MPRCDKHTDAALWQVSLTVRKTAQTDTQMDGRTYGHQIDALPLYARRVEA